MKGMLGSSTWLLLCFTVSVASCGLTPSCSSSTPAPQLPPITTAPTDLAGLRIHVHNATMRATEVAQETEVCWYDIYSRSQLQRALVRAGYTVVVNAEDPFDLRARLDVDWQRSDPSVATLTLEGPNGVIDQLSGRVARRPEESEDDSVDPQGLIELVEAIAHSEAISRYYRQLHGEHLARDQTPPDEAAQARGEWQAVAAGELARVEVERALFELSGNDLFYIHVAVRNLTDRAIGVDLQDPASVVYPNQWGGLNQQERQVIDERRIQHQPLDAARRASLLQAHQQEGLVTIVPSGSVDFYRAFNAGGRVEAAQTVTPFLFVSLDGQLLVSDGSTAETISLEWESQSVLDTNLILSTPIAWRQLPANARVIDL